MSVVPPGDVAAQSTSTDTAPPAEHQPFNFERATELQESCGVNYSYENMRTTTALGRVISAATSPNIPSMWENGPLDSVSETDVSFLLKTSRDPSTAQLVSKLASKLAHKLWKPATTRQKDMLALNRQMAGPGGYVGICKGFANVFAEGIECHNKVLSAQIKYLAHILSGLQGKFQEVADTPQYDAALRPAALCSILSKGNPLDKIRSEWAQKHCGVELPKDLQLSQPLMDTLDALVKLTYFPPWWAEADESFIEDGIAKLVTADKLLVEEFDRLKPHLLQKLRVEELDRLKPHLLQKLPLKSLIV